MAPARLNEALALLVPGKSVSDEYGQLKPPIRREVVHLTHSAINRLLGRKFR